MTTAVRRRVGAFTVLTLLAGSMTVVTAPVVSAHHPEIEASAACADGPVIDYRAYSWLQDPDQDHKSGNPDIGIYVDGVEVDRGAFTAGNGYEFSGRVDASPWAGLTVTVRAQADAPFNNGSSQGSYRETSVAVPGDCEQATTTTTVQLQPAEISIEPGSCRYAGGSPSTEVTIGIEPGSGATVNIEGPGGPHVVSGAGATLALGPGQYSWSAEAAAGFRLAGQSSGSFELEDCTRATARVWIRPGVCVWTDGRSITPVSVLIDPAGSAVVDIRSAEGEPVARVVESTVLDLGPGRYRWDASAGKGYVLGRDHGSFRVPDCAPGTVSVSVTVGSCVHVDGSSLTPVTVTIDPDSGATVVVDGPGGTHTVDGSGATLDLPPGAYTWTAEAAEGFELEGAASGGFTLSSCAPPAPATASVALGARCVTEGSAEVTLTVAPPEGASVVVTGPGGVSLAYPEEGSVLAGPVGTYTFAATAAAGFELAAGSEAGAVEVTGEDCALGAIGDLVWLDADADGMQEAEDPVPGVEVDLISDGTVIGSTITDAGGRYLFDDLPPGLYSVRFHLPDLEGLDHEAFTSPDQGDDAVDSDAGAGGLTAEVELERGEVDLTVDAGIVGAKVSSAQVTTTTTTAPSEPVLVTTTIAAVTASTLPFTGFASGSLALAALGILAVGLVLLAVGRSRPLGARSDAHLAGRSWTGG